MFLGGEQFTGIPSGGRPPISICSQLVGDHGPLGQGGCDLGLSARVHGAPSPSCCTEDHSSSFGSGEASRAPRGGGSASAEASGRPDSRQFDGRFLVQFLSGTEENGRLAAGIEPQAAECLHPAASVSDGDVSFRVEEPSSRSMGYLIGSEGCVPPHPYPPQRPGVASVSDWERSLPVSVPAIWAVNGTEGLYSGGEGSRVAPSSAGDQPDYVSRRLVDLQSDKGVVSASHSLGGGADNQTRLLSELEEVEFGTDPMSTISGSAFGSSSGEGVSFSGAGTQSDSLCPASLAGSASHGVDVAASLGAYGQYGGNCAELQIPHAADSVAPPSSLQAVSGRRFTSGPYVLSPRGGTRVVGLVGQPFAGSHLSGASSSGDSYHGCLRLRLGGGAYRGVERLGSLGGPRAFVARQHSRVAGGLSVASSLSGAPVRLPCPDSIGQHYCRSVHQPAGGHQVAFSVSPHETDASMVLSFATFC